MAKSSRSKISPSKSSTPTLTQKALILLLPPAILTGLWSGRIQQFLPASVQSYLSPSNLDTAPVYPEDLRPEICEAHRYTTEIISLDPLVIYINNFTSLIEAEELIKAGEADFEDSFISRSTGLSKVSGRTSQSAPLDPTLPLVSCILTRARRFMGSMLLPSEPFSIPQLVRYFPSQKYDLHTDFWPQHQLMSDGSGRRFNRVASFFVFLRANCTQGETYFPLVDVLDRDSPTAEGEGAGAGRGRGKGEIASIWADGKVSRGEKDGEESGVKFKPIAGNAIFWVNLDGQGNGDGRLVHAGLPVGEGEKVGLNLWPRKFYE